MDNICETLHELELDENQAAEDYKEKAKSSDGETASALLKIASDEGRHAELLLQLQKDLSCAIPTKATQPSGEFPPCTIKPEPMETWISLEFGPDGECRPCRMAPAASMYLGVLEKENLPDAAKQLEDAYESEDPLTLAKAMDSIKVSAKEPIKQKLKEIDCFTQSYQSEEAQDEEG